MCSPEIAQLLADRISNIKDTAVAAEVTVPCPSRVPLKLIQGVERSLLNQAFRQAKSNAESSLGGGPNCRLRDRRGTSKNCALRVSYSLRLWQSWVPYSPSAG